MRATFEQTGEPGAAAPAAAVLTPPPGRKGPQRLLLLFERDWDGQGFAPLAQAGEVVLHAEGFDLFSFPSNARLLAFDAWRFVERVCAKYRGRVDAVVSNNEQFGALLAAVVAQRLGLPGNDPAAIVRAQHKLLCRQLLRAALPAALQEMAAPAQALPFAIDDPRVQSPAELAAAVRALGLSFPLFVKPVKAAFSVLARTVHGADELARHLTFRRFERLVIERLVRPYAQVAARYAPLPCDPTAMLVESPCNGLQVNVDGYVFRGQTRIVGVVEERIYPQQPGGARHFARFVYPSRLAPALKARIEDAARRAVAAVGYTHGFFNCEFFVLPDGRLRFIEINPRLASQFVAMYRDLDGLDIYRMVAALAAGRDPATVPRGVPVAGAAASFVFRRFDGHAAPPPAAGAADWLAARHPRSELLTFHKHGRGLAREYKWLGSHRYAVVNHSAADADALEAEFIRICARFGWPYQPLDALPAHAPAPADAHAALPAPVWLTPARAA